MRETRGTLGLLAAATLATLIVAFPRTAEAQGHHGGFHGGIVVGPGFYGGPFYYGYGWPYYSYGWGPFYGPFGPYAYGPYGYAPYGDGGFTFGMAAANGIAGIDLNVKPGEAEVWVDGKFRGVAKDLDGSPNILWVRAGTHQLVIYKGGFKSFDETISVEPGQKLDLKVRMEKGDSQPPGSRPGAKAKTNS